MAWILRAGPYVARVEASTPIVFERLVLRARAAALGRYCSSAIAASTRSRVSSRMLTELFSTRETVWYETPAIRATSRIDAARGARVGVDILRLHRSRDYGCQAIAWAASGSRPRPYARLSEVRW